MPNVSAVLYKSRLYMCEVAQKTNVYVALVMYYSPDPAVRLRRRGTMPWQIATVIEIG